MISDGDGLLLELRDFASSRKKALNAGSIRPIDSVQQQLRKLWICTHQYILDGVIEIKNEPWLFLRLLQDME